MAVTHDGVFTAVISSGSVTSLTTTNAGAITAGDFIAVACRVSGISSTSASDSKNGTYTNADLDSTNSKGSFYFQNSAAAGNGADTLTISGTSGSIRIGGDFFGGVATSGQPLAHSQVGVTGTSIATGNIGTDSGGNAVWAAVVSITNIVTFTAGSTNGVSGTIGTNVNQASPAGSVATEYVTSDASGTQNFSMTTSAACASGDDMWGMIITAASTAIAGVLSEYRLGPLSKLFRAFEPILPPGPPPIPANNPFLGEIPLRPGGFWQPSKPLQLPPLPTAPARSVQVHLAAQAMGQRKRRKTTAKPRLQIGRAIARTVAYPIRVYRQRRSKTRARSKLRLQIGRAIARTYAYPVRVYLRRRSKIRGRPRFTRPIGRAVARAYAYPVRVYQVITGRSQSRKRVRRSRLRPQIGRAIARAFAYPIKVYQRRRRPTRGAARRTQPIGRAIARAVPYRIRTYLTRRPIQRSIRSRIRAGTRNVAVALGKFWPIRTYQQIAVRRSQERRRVRHSVVRLQIGRALARAYAYPISVYQTRRKRTRGSVRRTGSIGRAIARTYAYPVKIYQIIAGRSLGRKRKWTSRLRPQIGRAVARAYPYPIRVYGQGVKRGASPPRRRVLSRRIQPIGRAIARAVAYPVRVILAATKRQGMRGRFINRSRLRPPGSLVIVRQLGILLSVWSRHTVMIVRSRFPNFSLFSRKNTFNVKTRQVSLTVTTRKTSIIVRSR